jgi:hypothetical protein
MALPAPAKKLIRLHTTPCGRVRPHLPDNFWMPLAAQVPKKIPTRPANATTRNRDPTLAIRQTIPDHAHGFRPTATALGRLHRLRLTLSPLSKRQAYCTTNSPRPQRNASQSSVYGTAPLPTLCLHSHFDRGRFRGHPESVDGRVVFRCRICGGGHSIPMGASR